MMSQMPLLQHSEVKAECNCDSQLHQARQEYVRPYYPSYRRFACKCCPWQSQIILLQTVTCQFCPLLHTATLLPWLLHNLNIVLLLIGVSTINTYPLLL